MILLDEYFTSKWAMIELVALFNRVRSEQIGKSFFRIIPVYLIVPHLRILETIHRIGIVGNHVGKIGPGKTKE